MADDEFDDLSLADEAKLECASKKVRRGLAALRGTRRSNYLRRATQGYCDVKGRKGCVRSSHRVLRDAKLLVDAPSKGSDRANLRKWAGQAAQTE